MSLTQKLQKTLYYLRSGNTAAAEDLLGSILQEDQKNFNAIHLSGIVEFQRKNFSRAVYFFQLAAKINDSIFRIHFRLGLSLANLGRYKEAINAFQRTLELAPNYAEAHNCLGSALFELENYEQATKSFERALTIEPNFPEAYNNLGIALLELKHPNEAIDSFRRALDHKPNYPEAINNLGNALIQIRKYKEALIILKRAISFRDNFSEAHNNLGIAFLELNRYGDAIVSLQRALDLKPNDAKAHANLGIAYLRQGRHDDAIARFRRALALEPSYGEARSQLASEELIVCDWQNYCQTSAMVHESLDKEQEAVSPFVFLAFSDDPAKQLECARKYAREKIVSGQMMAPATVSPPDRKIRLAYLSTDFREHATAYLMSELFECHDTEKFEIHAVYFGAKGKDKAQMRLKQSFEYWHDVGSKSDQEIANLIRNEQIEIAIDLKGYTKDARPGILAYRPAPVQVNYLGYPGSMGVKFMDYILTDNYITAMDQQQFFDEKIVQLPNSYQTNDAQRNIAVDPCSKSAHGLPETGFIFCSFNNNWKISPNIFDIWMKLLRAIDGSVLWLLEDNRWAKDNLRQEALKRRVDPERLIFASRLPLAQHLARHRHADLFLDTLPCNAHTTASDALWAGLPLLTCAGRSFHARVAGSLLRAVGIPELVTENLEQYRALALKLARQPKLLTSYRERLLENRKTTSLFDSRRFAKNLEAAYTYMSVRWREGKGPASFRVIPSAKEQQG